MDTTQTQQMFADAQSNLTRSITMYWSALNDSDQNSSMPEARVRHQLEPIKSFLAEMTDTPASQWLADRTGIKLTFREGATAEQKEQTATQLRLAGIQYTQSDEALHITHKTMIEADFIGKVANAAINKRIDKHRAQQPIAPEEGPALRESIANDVLESLNGNGRRL